MKAHKKPFTIVIVFALMLLLGFNACDRGRLNIFSLQDDIELGHEVHNEILLNPQTYPILNKNEHQELYNHLYRIRDEILASGDIKYKNEFEWNLYIIDEDIVNAFAIPGGNTYYYTGLLRVLENEATLAGIMGHEIAHADLRHSTARLTKMYSYQTLLSIILGDNPSIAAEIAADLALGLRALAYSRQDEYEADEYSLKYLGPTEIDPRGVAYFFELFDFDPDDPPSQFATYFSTHPYGLDRIDEIYRLFNEEYNFDEGELFEDRYQEILNLLP